MRQVFDQLIGQLRNPASAETQNAMRMLNTPNPNDIPSLVNMRMNYQPPFFDSMGLFANFQETERAFAATVPGLDPNLWVNFVTQVRTFVQQPQQPQQMQPQQMQPQHRQFEAEPVLGPVPPMPRGISRAAARIHQYSIYDQAGLGGKKSRLRSKKRSRRSIHRRKKSMHKNRK